MVLSIGGLIGYSLRLFGGPAWWDMALFALFFLSTAAFLYSLASQCRAALTQHVMPYFPRSVGAKTFNHGDEIASRFRELQGLAVEHGLPGLDQFGFADEYRNEKDEWFDPKDALPTVEYLLGCFEDSPRDAKLRAQIVLLRDALELAQSKGLRFTLQIGSYPVVVPAEMDRRRGSFF